MANGEKGKGRSQNQRLKLFYLLDYLLEETDETHTKKVQEIIEHFENYYKIPVEQKTVCSDLHLLDEYGYETQYDGRTRGWRIIEREFDTQELQLLIDSVQASRFITQKKAKELTDKLKKKASRFDRVLLDRRCYVSNRVRSDNNSIFYQLDVFEGNPPLPTIGRLPSNTSISPRKSRRHTTRGANFTPQAPTPCCGAITTITFWHTKAAK